MTTFEAYCAAEFLGIRYARMCLIPLPATRRSPSVLLPIANVSGWLNLLTHEIVEGVWWSRQKTAINKWRVEKKLPPVKNFFGLTPLIRMQNIPLLAAFSPTVFPKPPEWGWDDSVCGFMFWSEEMEKEPIAPGLEDFLANGTPPIYFGFGSMPATSPERLLTVVKEVVSTLGCRAVICTGAIKVKPEDNKDIFTVQRAPHNWLFPRCQALVIHGGVGTTGAGFRSGRPIVVCPVFADQPFWGSLVFNHGCGPKPIPFKELNGARLSAALRYCQHPAVIAKAAILGPKIEAEWDNCASAVSWLEQIAPSLRPPIPKMATLGTGSVLVWKFSGLRPFLRLLIVFIVLLGLWFLRR